MLIGMIKLLITMQNIYLPKFSTVTATGFLSGMTRSDLFDVAIDDQTITIRKFVAPLGLC